MRTLIWLVVLLGSVPAAAVAYDPLVAGSHWAARDYVTVVLQHPGEEILVVVAPLLGCARRHDGPCAGFRGPGKARPPAVPRFTCL